MNATSPDRFGEPFPSVTSRDAWRLGGVALGMGAVGTAALLTPSGPAGSEPPTLPSAPETAIAVAVDTQAAKVPTQHRTEIEDRLRAYADGGMTEHEVNRATSARPGLGPREDGSEHPTAESMAELLADLTEAAVDSAAEHLATDHALVTTDGPGVRGDGAPYHWPHPGDVTAATSRRFGTAQPTSPRQVPAASSTAVAPHER